MNEELNILILSCGSRNKIVQYFKQELANKGLVIATDCSELAPALYDADKYYIVPRVDDETYLDTVLNICKKNKVKTVLSLIDPELNLLAKNKQAFLDIGTMPIISDSQVVELCSDKFLMYEYLIKNNFKTVKSYINKDKFYSDVKQGIISYPVFVKPVRGSASNNISKVTSKEEIEFLFERFDNLMIQEFMDGIEYGVDVYIDMISGEPVSIFIKKKIMMRAGETDKSVSVINKNIFDLTKHYVKQSGIKGVIDIDIFEINGEYYLSEVNPRFGGGYPHAYEAGVNIPKMIMQNIKGLENENEIGNYKEGIYMMKYNDMKVQKV